MVLGRTGDGESSQYSLQQNHDTGTKQYASDLIEIAGVRYTLAVIQVRNFIASLREVAEPPPRPPSHIPVKQRGANTHSCWRV